MKLTNKDGTILDLEVTEVNKVFLSPKTFCPRGEVICDTGTPRINLDGFVYTSIKGIDWLGWLHLIAGHAGRYRPQPYQQLATTLRAIGRDVDARRVLIAQEIDRYKKGNLSGFWIRAGH